MGVAVTDEATALGRFINRGLEHPEVLLGVAQGEYGLGLNALTVLSEGHSQEVRMTDIIRVVVPGCGGQPSPRC